MSDAILRKNLIRLAHEHPEFRADLLPLLKEAGQDKQAGAPSNFVGALLDLIQAVKTEDLSALQMAMINVREEARTLSRLVDHLNEANVHPLSVQLMRLMRANLRLALQD